MKRGVMALVGLLALAACGQESVEGNTYEAEGGAVKLEFKSGGKATFTIGAASQACNYNQDGKKVSVTCDNTKVDFTVADDGSLEGPQQALFGKLVKKKA